MERRTRTLRLLAAALLLFGFVYEVGHLRHHLEHARHHAEHAGDDHREHRECLVFHAGALVEPMVEAPPLDVVSAALPPSSETRAESMAACLLPDSRAPPASC